jgi:hypothetical protein
VGDRVYIRKNLAADKFRKAGDVRYDLDLCIVEKVIATQPLHSYKLKSVASGLQVVGTFAESQLIKATDAIGAQ